MPTPMQALLNLGAGQIVLILILLSIVAIPTVVAAVAIYLLVRANQRKAPPSPVRVPPRIPAAGKPANPAN